MSAAFSLRITSGTTRRDHWGGGQCGMQKCIPTRMHYVQGKRVLLCLPHLEKSCQTYSCPFFAVPGLKTRGSTPNPVMFDITRTLDIPCYISISETGPRTCQWIRLRVQSWVLRIPRMRKWGASPFLHRLNPKNLRSFTRLGTRHPRSRTAEFGPLGGAKSEAVRFR